MMGCVDLHSAASVVGADDGFVRLDSLATQIPFGYGLVDSYNSFFCFGGVDPGDYSKFVLSSIVASGPLFREDGSFSDVSSEVVRHSFSGDVLFKKAPKEIATVFVPYSPTTTPEVDEFGYDNLDWS